MPDTPSLWNASTSVEILAAQEKNNKLESLTVKIAGIVFTLLITWGVLSCINIEQQNDTIKKVLDILWPISFTGIWWIMLMQAWHHAIQTEIKELKQMEPQTA